MTADPSGSVSGIPSTSGSGGESLSRCEPGVTQIGPVIHGQLIKIDANVEHQGLVTAELEIPNATAGLHCRGPD